MKANDEMIKYPVGIQSFPKLRQEGYLYVDKTDLIYSLIRQGGYIFLSRPRRFGKSLLLSTIESYYRGERGLFKGLAIDSQTDDWDPHPVLHLDLNNSQYNTPGDLTEILDFHLRQWEDSYEVAQAKSELPLSLSLRFSRVISQAYELTGKKVVILVDEYDKPMLNAIGDPELADSFRSILKAFYSNLKTMDGCIQFAMLTGVGRFSKVSIFSDLNNLRDISFEPGYSSICGITEEEVDNYFADGIDILSRQSGLSHKLVREELRRRYDGYHFSKNAVDIYNPFSLVNVFAKMDFGSYWFDSGTPGYLVNLIRREDWRLTDLAPIEIVANELEAAGITTKDPIPALYQSGYLTIKDYDARFRTYTLDYPNEEVKEGFFSFLVPDYIRGKAQSTSFSIKKFVEYVNNGDPDGFMCQLESMLAGIPYSEKGSAESHFQNAIYILFTLLGFYATVEQRTSDGRMDLTVSTDRYVYIFEFKIDSSADKAIEQIHNKQYWLPYRQSGKEIILIGAGFDSHTRRLSGYNIESLQQRVE